MCEAGDEELHLLREQLREERERWATQFTESLAHTFVQHVPETIPGSTVSVVVSSSHCVTSHHGLVVARVLDSLAKRARKRSVGKLQGGNPSDGPDQSCMLHDVSEGGLLQLGYVIQVPVGILAPPMRLDTDCLSQRQKKRQMRRLRRSYCRTRFPEDQRNHLSLVTPNGR